MGIILFIVVLGVSYMLGAFGFAQIIGSLQNIKTRGPLLTLLTIVIWVAILLGSYFLMKKVVPSESIAYYIGLAVSLILVLKSGKIQ